MRDTSHTHQVLVTVSVKELRSRQKNIRRRHGSTLQYDEQRTPLFLHNTVHDSPSRLHNYLRRCGKRSSHASEYYSPSINRPNQKRFLDNTRTSFYMPVYPNTSTEPLEKCRPPKDLPGWVKDSKICLDENPDVCGKAEKHVQTPEERCAGAIRAKARETKQLYTQDCKTFAAVVKMIISKDQSLERRLLSALKKNLVDIRKQCLRDLRQFISDVIVPLKPEQSAKLYRILNKKCPRCRKHI